MARLIVDGAWDGYRAQTRWHQPVYALLLTPSYLLNLPAKPYVFALHTILSCATMYLLYVIARRLFGPVCALASALAVAGNLMIALWFPWASGDIAFHFFIALFAWTAVQVWEAPHARGIFVFALCGAVATLTRPEGLFVAAVAAAVLARRLSAGYLSPVRFAALLLGVVVAGGAVVGGTLYVNRPVREVFFSNIHVAYPLFISTRMATNSPAEQVKAYDALATVIKEAAEQPGYVSAGYALSMEGLRFIREHPGTWAQMYLLRFASIVFPSAFSPWWSARNRIYSFTMSLFLVGGAVLAWWRSRSRRLQIVGLTLMGFTIVMVVSLFQREVDHRVPLSMDLLLATVAPFGWLSVPAGFSDRPVDVH
jgi:hypothetical protein